MKRTIRLILITLLAYGIHYAIDEAYFKSIRKALFEMIGQFGFSHILAYVIVGLPIFLGILLMHGTNGFFGGLGFNRSMLLGLAFTLLCTLPMFVGFALVYDLNLEYSIDNFLVTVVAAAFFEELYFRAFLFGQLYRFAHLGFVPAVILGAFLFGFLHWYQGSTFSESLGVFAITLLAGLLFAWLYAEWRFNIWVPLFLHFFMNLAWGLFSVSDNAMGGAYANIFRFTTVFLVIGGTVIFKRMKGERLEVKGKALLIKTNG